MATIDKDQLDALTDALLKPVGHKISGNSQGGYDCTCGGRWDWQRSEKAQADRHAAEMRARQLIEAGVTIRR